MSPRTPNSIARGLFFDLSPPVTDNDKSEAEAHLTHINDESPMAKSKSSERTSPAPEWWEANAAHADQGYTKSTNSAAKMMKMKANMRASEFKPNLPEHLPNSPLCPKNLMHKSGRIGICVYHGRRRSLGFENVSKSQYRR